MSRLRRVALTSVSLTALLTGAAAAQSNSILNLLPTDGRRLEQGEFTGALSASDFVSTDGYLLEAWEMEGRAGETVTLDLESESFDPTLYVVGPGFGDALWDYDSGGGCNARLTVTFLEDGTFRVVAGSFAEEPGTYTIRVSDRPGPAPTFGCGELDPRVLAELPTEGRTLRVGSLEAGVLGTASRSIQDGRPGEAWELRGSAGERVSVILESDDFDAFLYLTGPGLSEILTDDDGAGDLNARIDVTLPSDGPFTVVASALGAGGFGAYLLRVREGADPGQLPYTAIVPLGETVEAELLGGEPVLLEGRQGQVWGFQATAGQSVVIDLRSEAFDTYLFLAGPGFMDPLSNDDSGSDRNAQLSVTFPESATYRIIAAAYSSDASGPYTLSVRPR